MRIYLAARYSRRLELCEYREQLCAIGYDVQAVWLDGEHQISDTGAPIGNRGEMLVEGDDGSATERAASLRRKFAADDFRDVEGCDLLIAFTEPPRSGHSRGGRHVELGIALGMRKRVAIVGPRENIFCWLDGIHYFSEWTACVRWLQEELTMLRFVATPSTTGRESFVIDTIKCAEICICRMPDHEAEAERIARWLNFGDRADDHASAKKKPLE